MKPLRDVLGEHHPTLPALYALGVNSDEDLASAYLNINKQMSSSRRVPDAQAPKEDWNKYYSAIGRPESVDGYGISQSTPDNLREVLEGIRPAAHETGLTKDQIAKAHINERTRLPKDLKYSPSF